MFLSFIRMTALISAVYSPLLAQAACNLTTPRVQESNQVPTITSNSTQNQANYTGPIFPLLGFQQYSGNPILGPNKARNWESKYVFNPATIVIDMGVAWSDDGYHFTRYTKPVITSSEAYETHGCEDPRIVRVNGTFYLTYTGFKGSVAKLCLATSTDLVNRTKHGPILPDCTDFNYLFNIPQNAYAPRTGWIKSGAIADEPVNGINQMQWGDNWLMSANSTDMIHWNYIVGDIPFAQKQNIWEQGLMESGAPPVKTRDGKYRIKFYNGVALGAGGYKTGSYNTGQMLIDLENAPRGPPIARVESPLLQPLSSSEDSGQVDNVVFTEGLVQFNGKWMMYFGEADTFVDVATADVQP